MDSEAETADVDSEEAGWVSEGAEAGWEAGNDRLGSFGHTSRNGFG